MKCPSVGMLDSLKLKKVFTLVAKVVVSTVNSFEWDRRTGRAESVLDGAYCNGVIPITRGLYAVVVAFVIMFVELMMRDSLGPTCWWIPQWRSVVLA